LIYVDPTGHEAYGLGVNPNAIQDYITQYLKEYLSSFADYVADKANDLAVAYLEWIQKGSRNFRMTKMGFILLLGYSGAAEPQFRRFGNRLSGTGNYNAPIG